MCNLKIATYNNEGNRRRLNIYGKEHELTVVTKQLMPNNICQKPNTDIHTLSSHQLVFWPLYTYISFSCLNRSDGKLKRVES